MKVDNVKMKGRINHDKGFKKKEDISNKDGHKKNADKNIMQHTMKKKTKQQKSKKKSE